jgi:hypothetical protein
MSQIFFNKLGKAHVHKCLKLRKCPCGPIIDVESMYLYRPMNICLESMPMVLNGPENILMSYCQ